LGLPSVEEQVLRSVAARIIRHRDSIMVATGRIVADMKDTVMNAVILAMTEVNGVIVVTNAVDVKNSKPSCFQSSHD